MEQQSNYKPGSVRGRVSDIRVLDEHGNVVEHFEGGDNTISSGASFDLLAWSFFPYSNGYTASSNTQCYQDANGYYFPCLYQLFGYDGVTNYGPNIQNLVKNLFGQIVGVKGGSAGLSSHQTVISNMNPAWVFCPGGNNAYNDLYTPINNTSTNQPSTSFVTFTTSSSLSSSGVPSITITVTVNSTASATAYTIDSIAWIPCAENRSTSNGTLSTNGIFSGFWGPSTTSGTFTFNSWGAAFSSNNVAPQSVSTYISALFVLPYTVTVNPGGAFQFSYTFQGA